MKRRQSFQFLSPVFLCAVFFSACSNWGNDELFSAASERARTLTAPSIAVSPSTADYLPSIYKSTSSVTVSLTQESLSGATIHYNDGTGEFSTGDDTCTLTFTNSSLTWTFPHYISLSAWREHSAFRNSGYVYAGLTFVETGSIIAFAGQGTAGYLGDGTYACWSTLNNPTAVCADSGGNLYIADSGNAVVRKVDTSGYLSTFVGASSTGASVAADLSTSLALCQDDTNGYLYILDRGNSRILQVSGTTATELDLSTSGYSLNSPASIAIDDTGTILYVGDTGTTTGRILELTISGSSVTAVAPLMLSSTLSAASPGGLCFDKQDKVLYIADTGGNLVYSYTISTSTMAIFAGTGTADFSGDGSAATAADLDGPTGLAFENSGKIIYIADTLNERIRAVAIGSGKISTFAGQGANYPPDGDGNLATLSGNNGPAAASFLYNPQGLFISSKDIFIADTGNHCIRRVISF